jgi:integrase
LADGLATRERTLVLLAASTGLRQSELFGLQWGDISFAEGTMNVTRSIVCGVVGRCKTESSQKPVPIHPLIVESLVEWKEHQQYRKHGDWVSASSCRRGRKPYWGAGDPAEVHPAQGAGAWNRKEFRMAHVSTHVLDLLRSVGTEF